MRKKRIKCSRSGHTHIDAIDDWTRRCWTMLFASAWCMRPAWFEVSAESDWGQKRRREVNLETNFERGIYRSSGWSESWGVCDDENAFIVKRRARRCTRYTAWEKLSTITLTITAASTAHFWTPQRRSTGSSIPVFSWNWWKGECQKSSSTSLSHGMMECGAVSSGMTTGAVGSR